MSDQPNPLAGQPVYRWQEMGDYNPGKLVLIRTGPYERTYLAERRDGIWFEMVDGEWYELKGYTPTEWCDPPNGVEAWAM